MQFKSWSILIFYSGNLRKALKKLAKAGCLSFAIDHKWIKNKQGDREAKALGLSVIISSEDGSRTPFLIGYIPTDDATDFETIRLVEETFEDLDLMESFKNLEIPMTSDAQLRHALEKIYNKHLIPALNAICTSHNLTNLGKNALIHLKEYLANSEDFLRQHNINLEIAGKKLENHFKSLEVADIDREHVGELSVPNWSTMSETERKNTKLNYLPIPKEFGIRFRNGYQRTAGLFSRIQELQRIKSNARHPLDDLVEDLDVGPMQMQFLKALYAMQKHLVGLIDYYESNSTFQSTDTINSLLYGFDFCLDIDKNENNKFEIATKLALLDALTEQLTSHRAIKRDGKWIWKKTSKPTRIRRFDKIGTFAFPSMQRLQLNRLMKKLKLASKKFRSLKTKFQVNI